MRKIILSVAVSLDGFIEGPKGEYDWCPPPSKKEMVDFLETIDTIFMGRKSYEMAGTSMFKDKDYYIFSDTLDKVKGKNTYLVRSNMLKTVKTLTEEKGKNIWLFGGAGLTTTFINENLVDEMWLGVVPIILGKGKSLFQNIAERKKYKVVESKMSDQYLSLKLVKNNSNHK